MIPAEIQLCLIVLALPLAAFTLQIFLGRFLPAGGDWLPTGAMFVCSILSLYLFCTRVYPDASWGPIVWKWNWIELTRVGAKPFLVNFGVTADNMSITMLAMVTTVSFLIHLFSWGYMEGEKRYHRFFAFLALFTFSMIGLVLVNNLLFLFIFWELVGLCSYFLIGFYFEKKSAQNAANKAFITTRVGDVGFLLGMMIILMYVGNLDYESLFWSIQHPVGFWVDNNGQNLTMWGLPLLTVAGILVFYGAVGKSAQFPLHVWLPDAMEGPTPVSALIHAATMVAAGVYMVARLYPFFAGPGFFTGDYYHSQTLTFIALTGGVTALMAATIAVVQYDIKKVLAYSTVSQLGFMMMGLGVGALWAGMFHLLTHAFFKALLFLGSGSVIYGCHHEQDMRKMGGLKKKMPVTYWTFLAGTLALAGVPFFSGFWSKEPILTEALAWAMYRGAWYHWVPFVCGISAAFLTAFYLARAVGMTFHGEPKDHHVFDHAHESPWVMTGPLVILAVFAVLIGGIGVPFFEGMPGKTKWFQRRVNAERIGDWYHAARNHLLQSEDPKTGFYFAADHASSAASDLAADGGDHHEPGEAHDTSARGRMEEERHHAHWPTVGMASGVLAFGLYFGWLLFVGPWKGKDPVKKSPALQSAKRVLENLYYIDWFYYKVFFAGVHGAKHIARAFDKYVIETIVNTTGWLVERIAFVAGGIDYFLVDGMVRLAGAATLEAGEHARKTQTGRLQEYVAMSVILIGLIFVVAVLISVFAK